MQLTEKWGRVIFLTAVKRPLFKNDEATNFAEGGNIYRNCKDIGAVKQPKHILMFHRKAYKILKARLMICKTISTFVYRNRTQLYGAYASKYGKKALWRGAYK